MKGISTPQVAVIVALFLGLVATAVLVVLEEWKLAALGSLGTLGLFVAFVILTLAAMTHAASTTRRRVLDISRQTRQVVSATRRVDRRTAERFKMLESHQERLEATERRLLGVIEAQRFQLEDDLESINEKLRHPANN